MSDTAEMVRLMRHAATLLDAAQERTHDARQLAAALATGAATLRLIAASVAPGPDAAVIDYNEYEQWRDKNDGVMMSPGELDSIGRFLRSKHA